MKSVPSIASPPETAPECQAKMSGTTLPFSGYMFASVGINRVVSAAELDQTEAWVNSKTAAY